MTQEIIKLREDLDSCLLQIKALQEDVEQFKVSIESKCDFDPIENNLNRKRKRNPPRRVSLWCANNDVFVQYIREHRRVPVSQSTDTHEQQLANWYTATMNAIKDLSRDQVEKFAYTRGLVEGLTISLPDALAFAELFKNTMLEYDPSSVAIHTPEVKFETPPPENDLLFQSLT